MYCYSNMAYLMERGFISFHFPNLYAPGVYMVTPPISSPPPLHQQRCMVTPSISSPPPLHQQGCVYGYTTYIKPPTPPPTGVYIWLHHLYQAPHPSTNRCVYGYTTYIKPPTPPPTGVYRLHHLYQAPHPSTNRGVYGYTTYIKPPTPPPTGVCTVTPPISSPPPLHQQGCVRLHHLYQAPHPSTNRGVYGYTTYIKPPTPPPTGVCTVTPPISSPPPLHQQGCVRLHHLYQAPHPSTNRGVYGYTTYIKPPTPPPTGVCTVTPPISSPPPLHQQGCVWLHHLYQAPHPSTNRGVYGYTTYIKPPTPPPTGVCMVTPPISSPPPLHQQVMPAPTPYLIPPLHQLCPDPRRGQGRGGGTQSGKGYQLQSEH